jgi:hypothetical protein
VRRRWASNSSLIYSNDNLSFPVTPLQAGGRIDPRIWRSPALLGSTRHFRDANKPSCISQISGSVALGRPI